jgi:hypothetical protein
VCCSLSEEFTITPDATVCCRRFLSEIVSEKSARSCGKSLFQQARREQRMIRVCQGSKRLPTTASFATFQLWLGFSRIVASKGRTLYKYARIIHGPRIRSVSHIRTDKSPSIYPSGFYCANRASMKVHRLQQRSMNSAASTDSGNADMTGRGHHDHRSDYWVRDVTELTGTTIGLSENVFISFKCV